MSVEVTTQPSTGVVMESTTEPARVLIVGDEAQMVELLCAALRFAGFQVRTACSGGEAVAVAEQWAPDVVAQDGFEITRNVRGRRRTVPALFLTPGDQLQSKVPGLTIGGGDYVTKPFSPDELVARIRTVLRRICPESAIQTGDGLLRFADLELAEETYDVRRAGRPVQLTPTEFKLLRYLMHNAERVVSRAQILDHVWHYGYGGSQTVVEGYIFRLRCKVDNVAPPLIHTVRGVGYSLRLPRT